MLTYETIPYNVTITRANLDSAYAAKLEELFTRISREESAITDKQISAAADAATYVSNKIAGMSGIVHEQTFSSRLKEVFTGHIEAGHTLLDMRDLGAGFTASHWQTKKVDVEALKASLTAEAQELTDAAIARYQTAIDAIKAQIQDLVNFYRKEHQRIDNPKFWTPEGYK
ncbi:hypothetical protein [Escherichia coli]|uniref:hypothetical protein n=1 Tax=Escherichia coli TaxID=562 RepID=UPI001CA6DC0A|nr:hypothetical protein [Escherichia coli]QZY67676.1 hypothetical protein K7X33_16410 [Escherichia coli]